MGIKVAIENIRNPTKIEAEEEIYGPINGLCPVCGKPARTSEGYICSCCSWEIEAESTPKYICTGANPTCLLVYKLLYKLFKNRKEA